MRDKLRLQSWVFDWFMVRYREQTPRIGKFRTQILAQVHNFLNISKTFLILDVFFRVFRFPKASFNAVTSSFII